MAGNRRRLIEGFRFVCPPGREECPICTPYCGQEYVHEPKAGQNPIGQRPKMPLHNHCRCWLELITNTLRIILASGPAEQTPTDIHGVNPTNPWDCKFNTPGLSEHFNAGRLGYLGLVYCTDGREMSDGPTYGNYGGMRWRFGRNEDKIAELAEKEGLTVDEWLAENYKPPIDSLDSIYEDHDYCYGKVEGQHFYSQSKLSCDEKVIESMRNLDEDPRNWPDPPKSEEDIEYARKFRAHALMYFEAKVDYASLREKYGEEYMKSEYWLLKYFLEPG